MSEAGNGSDGGPGGRADQPGIGQSEDGGAEHVLVVDDDPFIARLLEIELRATGYDVAVAGDGKEALERVRERVPALVLCDVMMPNMDGLELTRRLRSDPSTSGVSVILLTARGLSADKLEGFSVGADDYIVKPFDTPELLARIRGVLRRAREMRAQSPLTGLPGNVRIQDEIDERVTDGRPFAILYTDLDAFKAYNDHYGFARGDQMIQFTAGMLQEVATGIAGIDAFVGHVGGDDFVLIVDPQYAQPIAERIVQRFDAESGALYDTTDHAQGFIQLMSRSGESIRFPLLSISIGIATTDRRSYSHYAEAVAIATEMKQFTKQQAGSSWALDRRTI
ncbi:MAG: response regulator [Actinomycetota bacterium]